VAAVKATEVAREIISLNDNIILIGPKIKSEEFITSVSLKFLLGISSLLNKKKILLKKLCINFKKYHRQNSGEHNKFYKRADAMKIFRCFCRV